MFADVLRICERKLTAEVLLTADEGCESVTTVVTRKKYINDSCCKRLDIVDDTWTALVKYKDDRTSCCSKSLHELLLICRKVHIHIVTRSLTICILTDTCDDHIRLTCSLYCFLYTCLLIEGPVCSHEVILYSRNIFEIRELLCKSFIYCVILVSKVWP